MAVQAARRSPAASPDRNARQTRKSWGLGVAKGSWGHRRAPSQSWQKPRVYQGQGEAVCSSVALGPAGQLGEDSQRPASSGERRARAGPGDLLLSGTHTRSQNWEGSLAMSWITELRGGGVG